MFPSVNFIQSSLRHLGGGGVKFEQSLPGHFWGGGGGWGGVCKKTTKNGHLIIILFGLKSVKVGGYKRKGVWQNWPSLLFSQYDVVSFGG